MGCCPGTASSRTTSDSSSVPGAPSRFVFALPQPSGRVYVGLTDEPTDGPVPDVPEPTEEEVDFLLAVAEDAVDRAVARARLVAGPCAEPAARWALEQG
jgi:glycerol-3-phosphate dehydrogenase